MNSEQRANPQRSYFIRFPNGCCMFARCIVPKRNKDGGENWKGKKGVEKGNRTESDFNFAPRRGGINARIMTQSNSKVL